MRRSASTSSVLACIVSNVPGGRLSTCLAGHASSADWRCSYLCSGLIPSVTEKSALFVKELSFPQTTPNDDAFFNRTGLERIGVVGPEIGPLLGWSIGSGLSGRR